MVYFFSLLRTSIRLRNIGILFFMFLNSTLLFYFGQVFFHISFSSIGHIIAALLLFTIIYYTVVLIIGKIVIRLFFGGNQIIMGNDTSSVSLAFAEAYTVAKQNDPSLSDNIKLYVCITNYPDAYAFGRDTILISEPAAQLHHSQLRTLFLEKFAQLSNHDSERMLFLIAGNAIFVVAIAFVKIIVYVVVAFIGIAIFIARSVLSIFMGHLHLGSGFLALSGYFQVCRVLSNALEAVLLFFLNLIIRVALLSSSSNYYVNDQFVCDCGYSLDLRYYLQYVEPDISGFQSTLATITASKPSRLARLSHISDYDSYEPTHNNVFNLFGTFHQHLPRLGHESQLHLERNSSTSFQVISRNESESENGSDSESENQNSTISGFRILSRSDEQ